MITEFSFLTDALKEERSYQYSVGHYKFIMTEYERISSTYADAEFRRPFDGPGGTNEWPALTVSHVFAPPKESAKDIESEFDIHLPDDFLEFYRLWNEGLLLVRNPVIIMNPRRIIQVTADMREAQCTPAHLPHHIVRFGWLGTDFHFLLRFDPSQNDWHVMLSSWSHDTEESLLDENDYGTPTDATFAGWLKRMLQTDGAPLHPKITDDEDDYFNLRVS